VPGCGLCREGGARERERLGCGGILGRASSRVVSHGSARALEAPEAGARVGMNHPSTGEGLLGGWQARGFEDIAERGLLLLLLLLSLLLLLLL
jgi:hypothetical protein